MDESRQPPDNSTEITLPHSLSPINAQEQGWLERLLQLAAFSSEHDSLIEVVRYTYKVLETLAPDAFMVSLYYSDEDETEHIYAVVDDREVSNRNYKARNKLSGSRIEPLIRGKKLMLVDNWQVDEEHNYQVVSLGRNPPRVHTLLDIPLVIGDQVLGGMHLQSYRYKAWNTEEIEFAQAIGAVLAGATLNHWIISYRSSKKSYASCLHTISLECCTTAPIEEICARVTEIIARFIGGMCTLLLKQGDKVKLAALFHNDPVMRAIQTEFATQNLDKLLKSGWAMPLQTGESVLIANLGERKSVGEQWLSEGGIITLAAAPLLMRGDILGQLTIARFAPANNLHDYDLRLLEAAAVYLSLAMENEQLRAGR